MQKNHGLPIVIPEWFAKMNSMPDDPPLSVPYGYETEKAECFVMIQPIQLEQAMPFEHPEAVVDGIHHALGDNQGLIDVKTGKTNASRNYIYSIVKTLNETRGVQYCLTMHLDFQDYAVQVQGFFDELGTTGVRDAIVYALTRGERTGDPLNGWVQDPFDPGYTRGVPMNRSENEKYDAQFPAHPLSELRKFLSVLVESN